MVQTDVKGKRKTEEYMEVSLNKILFLSTTEFIVIHFNIYFASVKLSFVSCNLHLFNKLSFATYICH